MPDNKNYCVYLHTIPKEISGYENDKYYVGITKQGISRRWRKNGKGYETQNFWKVIQKYGWDNIKHEIIAENLTHDEACKLEKEYISSLRTTERQFGYNLTTGGDGNFNWSEESKKKLSQSRKGKYTGENSPLYGKSKSPEHIKHLCEAQKKRYLNGAKAPTYGKKYTPEERAHISKRVKEALKDKTPYYKGKKMPLEICKKISQNHADVNGSKNPKSISIICYCISGKEIYLFGSIASAAKNLQLDRDGTRKALRTGKAYRGFLFYEKVKT